MKLLVAVLVLSLQAASLTSVGVLRHVEEVLQVREERRLVVDVSERHSHAGRRLVHAIRGRHRQHVLGTLFAVQPPKHTYLTCGQSSTHNQLALLN